MLITDKKVLANYTASKCLWLGIPSIEVTKKGRTFLTFYSGGTKEEMGNYVLLVKSEDGITFSNPIAVCFEEEYRCFDPCLWIDPLGRLWFTWSRCPQDGLFGAICDDPDADEIVFSKEFFIGNNVMMNKPIVLSTGEWMFPVAVWNKGIRALPSNYDSNVVPKGSFAYITCDKGKTFKKLGYADVKKRSFDEHMFLEMDDRVLRVFVRTSYGIGAADSYDGGNHWGNDFDTGYGGPCSRFHIRRLPSGRILLINHYRFNGRNNLTALLSEDNRKTFPYRLLLDERNSVSTCYDNGVVDEICSYIIDNLESNCSVENIADKFNFSANYIRHIFKKKTGISISEFKKTQILKKARLLLKASDRKITDIAAECGYDNPSYFSEFFKNEVGVSPKDYRQGC